MLKILIMICILANIAFANDPIENPLKNYPSVKVMVTTYFTHLWSTQGAYKKVSKNNKRLGNYVAINFLPSGSIVMIPELFKTTKLEVADTLGGSGIKYYKGKKYWKVDILRDKSEWIDDFDHPLNLYVVKINKNGKFRDNIVRQNYYRFLKSLNPTNEVK